MQQVFLQYHRNVEKNIRMTVFLLWLSLLLGVTASTSIGKICSKVHVAICRVAETKTTCISTWSKKYRGSFGEWWSWRSVLIPHTWRMSSDKESIETLEGHCLPHPCLSCCTERQEPKNENTMFFSRLLPQWNYFGELQGRNRLLLRFTLALLACIENPIL